MECFRGVVMLREELDKILKKELDKTFKEGTIEILDKDKIQVDFSRNQQVDSGGN